jgi:glycosyltransferase involved in cell wall biosynthesis
MEATRGVTGNVVHVCPAYFPIRGGIEVLVETMIPLLLSDHGFGSSVITPRNHNERPDGLIHNGALVYSVDLFSVVEQKDAAHAFASIFSEVRNAVSSERPDLVHIHGFSPLALAAASVARTLKIPYLAHIHGVIDRRLPPHFLRLVANAHHVVCASSAIEKSLDFMEIASDLKSVIPNGIVPTKPSWPVPAEPLLLVVGRLEPEKGFADAVDALALVRREFPNAALKIIGSGGELYPLQQLASQKKLSDRVEFLGALSQDAVMKEIKKASIVLVPSLVTEGFSLVAAEAAMAGRPVVATRVGGLPETVQDGLTGILVEPNSPLEISSAIQDLWGNRQKLEALATQAAAYALKAFNIGRFAKETSILYSSMLSRIEGP